MQPAARRGMRNAVCLICLCAVLWGCSATQWAYNRLDWFVGWQLDRYLSLEAEQALAFDLALERVWDWHRYQALPDYAEDLKRIAATAPQSLSVSQFEAWAMDAARHWNRLIHKLVPEACALMPGLSDQQVSSVLAQIDEQIAEDEDEYLLPPESEVREQAEKRLRRSLKRWVGRLSDSQQAQVKQFSQDRPLRYQQWIDGRRQWRDQFAALLQARRADQFCAGLGSMLVSDEVLDPEAVEEHSQLRTWSRFLADFSQTLNGRQQVHARERLLALASDLEQLGALPQSAAPSPLSGRPVAR